MYGTEIQHTEYKKGRGWEDSKRAKILPASIVHQKSASNITPKEYYKYIRSNGGKCLWIFSPFQSS